MQDRRCAVEVAISFLKPRESKQRLADLRRRGDRFLIQRARFLHPALVLQIPRQIGEQDRIALVGEIEDAAIVVFADLRPVGLGQYHAHQVVRLWVFRRDADGVARMVFGFREIAFAQQDQRQLVGGCQVVGIERDNAVDQRVGRLMLALGLADFVQD
jgi:hypothetical protein